MPDEASMSFKVYLDLGGGRQEVRRFGLPETVATNYTVLREKVCSIFGLSNQDALLSWKDSEGDSITISSDDELMEAVADSLSNQNVQLVRINVVEGSSSSSAEPGPSGPQGNQQGAVHPGVTCDSCNGRVQGFRYKCVSCPDFDLCGACETKGMHKEHKMMRLPKPQDAGGPWFYWREKEDAPGQYSTHFGVHGKDAGGGGFSSSASFSGCGGGGGGGGAGGAGSWWGFGGPRGRHCYRRGHGARGRGGWPTWWGRGWNGRNWAACAQGQTLNSDCGSQQQQQQSSSQHSQQSQQQSQQQQSQQQQSHQQQQSSGSCPGEENCPWVSRDGASCPFTGEESEMPSAEQVAEEAKHMAEQMAQQAHHFASHYASDHLANVMRGIWTAWTGQQGQNSASHSGSTSSDDPQQDASAEQEKRKEAGQSKEASHSAGEEYLRSVGETVANMLDPLGIDVEVAVEHNGIRQRCSLGENVSPSPRSNASPTPTSPAKEPASSAASVASGGSVNMEVQTDCPSGSQASNKDVEAMDVASPAPAESSQKSGEQLESHSGSPEPEDWMLVNQETPSEAAASSGTRPQTPPAEKSVSYPSLAELTPHPDPKIQRALEHMSVMGYSNEGGWLTNLLEMKQGDINQVLDLLQPVNK